MPLNYIVHIVANCFCQSLPFIILWSIGRMMILRKRTTYERKQEIWLWVLVIYLILLVQITVFRFGIQWVPLDVPRQTNWQPLTTLALLTPWAQFYNIVGNIVWFVPLGLTWSQVWRKWRWWQVVLLGFCLSVSIETLQYLFYTGITDVDDVIFNTLGTTIGYALQAIWRKIKRIIAKNG